jgi:type IV pilus assembly protein PilC
MDRSIHFDRMLTSLVRWGEDHDLMPAALLHAHQYYDDRIDHQAALVRRILPPLMMVVVAIAVVFVVISLFLPLVGLIQGLSM